MTEPKNPPQANQAEPHHEQPKKRRRRSFAVRGAAKMARALERRGALRLRW